MSHRFDTGRQESTLLQALLSVCKVNDECVVTNHRQTLKEVMELVIDHGVCISFLLMQTKYYKLTGLKQ